MFPTAAPPIVADRPTCERPTARATCPVCGAEVIEARGLARCVRCQFTLCVGCEGGPTNDGANGAWDD
jgi:hypothetical protein